ncbi:hypothetical protein ACFU9B_35485 [Streptomyces sp. NPDC057592]|uniref:hypothetical protein n=1 Tax=unclassified Streptomyces TaxID=2593676 RepID=UPI0036BC58C8
MWTTQGERSVWGQVPDEGDPREGLTASHLSTDTYSIGPGDTAVVHAAAGGVGLHPDGQGPWRPRDRAVPREGKAPVAKKAGADHVLVPSGDGFEERIRELTGGWGAETTFQGALPGRPGPGRWPRPGS